MFAPAAIQQLTGERLHLSHGPIDVVLKAWGQPEAVRAAYAAAAERFPAILPELCDELVALRTPMREDPKVDGPVARRMVEACRPFAGVFVTPMAAVAGAVADELLAHMTAAGELERAFVNDGGDIAVAGHARAYAGYRRRRRVLARRRAGDQRPRSPRCGLGRRRHRHVGGARALVLARHRQLGDDPGSQRGDRRRGGNAGRQCRRPRQPRRSPPARARARSRQRPARLGRDGIGRHAGTRRRSPQPWAAASSARSTIADAASSSMPP